MGRREQIGMLLEPPKDELELVVRLVVGRLKGMSQCVCLLFLTRLTVGWIDEDDDDDR